MKTSALDQYLAAARSTLVRLEPADAFAATQRGALLVDIRPEFQRRRDGEVPASIVVERNHLEWRLHPDSSARIPEAASADVQWIVLCDEGYASSLAAAVLQMLGLRRATDVVGGLRAWRAAGLPLGPPGAVSAPRLAPDADSARQVMQPAADEARYEATPLRSDRPAARTPMLVTTRAAVPADRSFLEEMLHIAVWSAPGSARPARDILDRPELRQYVVDWGHHDGDIGLVAESADLGLLGAAWLRLLPGGYGFVAAGTPELSIALVPRARHGGVGRQLLSGLIARARPRFSSISLSVAPASPAVAFYRAMGFIDHEHRGDSLVMLRKLGPMHGHADP